jgi:hypothetical protein
VNGHGQKLTARAEALIAALLTESTHANAADKAGVSETTVRRWLRRPAFRRAYKRARRQLVEGAIGRIQAATGAAVDALLSVARTGAKDGDRVRAAVALLEFSFRGLVEADTLDGDLEKGDSSPMDPAGVVAVLAGRLRQVDEADLPSGEKGRLTASLADSLLRAIGINEIAQRLEALQAVLLGRKEREE